ncbi:uncharacterized protein [Antedon mediterranea]|uniref:uncharacterized protein n=1 Tax=Antedon mediterranea TaxID=105859 RepID=UPI003AF94696
MASSSSSFASTKRRSQSSPELLLIANDEKKAHRDIVTRSLVLNRTDNNQENNDDEKTNTNEEPPIPVEAVTVITTDSSSSGTRPSLTCENISIHSANSLSRPSTSSNKLEKNEKEKHRGAGSHIQNGAFAHQEANFITVEYDSSDDSGEDTTKNYKRSRFDQWKSKIRTLFRGKEKENDDRENRVQEASDSDDDNITSSDYDKCRDRSRSQSLYGCLRNYVRKEDENESPPKKKTSRSFFAKRSRSRSRNKKPKSQPPDNRTSSDKQCKETDKKRSDYQTTPASNGSHVLTPIEQAELLDTGLPLPAGSNETEGTEAPSQVDASNSIVTQDLYGQFGSHTQNGYIPRTVHTQIDYIHCLVPQLKSILDKPCYWGKIDRYQADALLENKPEGTYLLRDSAQEEFLFSVSFRRYGRSLHARLEQWSHRFSFDAHDPGVYSSDTVTGLLEHYKDPNCCMFFEPMLTTPLPRPNPHSLKELCRGIICSNVTYDAIHLLKLPQNFKEYLREYHYKQRVRVRRFEIDYLPHQTRGRRQTLTNTCISY